MTRTEKSSTHTFYADDAAWNRYLALVPLKIGIKASKRVGMLMLQDLQALEGAATPERAQETALSALDLQVKNEGLARELDKLAKTLKERELFDELMNVVFKNERYKIVFGGPDNPAGNTRQIIAKLLRDFPNLQGEKDLNVGPGSFQMFIHYLEIWAEQRETCAKLESLQRLKYAGALTEAEKADKEKADKEAEAAEAKRRLQQLKDDKEAEEEQAQKEEEQKEFAAVLKTARFPNCPKCGRIPTRVEAEYGLPFVTCDNRNGHSTSRVYNWNIMNGEEDKVKDDYEEED